MAKTWKQLLQTRCHKLYDAANHADMMYSRAILRHAPGRDRWMLTPKQKTIPAISKAYRRKVALDAARSRACRVGR